MPDYYNLCDTFLLANCNIASDFDGFGMVFTEANACGKLVVAGRTGGTSEAVQENVTGILIDTDDRTE